MILPGPPPPGPSNQNPPLLIQFRLKSSKSNYYILLRLPAKTVWWVNILESPNSTEKSRKVQPTCGKNLQPHTYGGGNLETVKNKQNSVLTRPNQQQLARAPPAKFGWRWLPPP